MSNKSLCDVLVFGAGIIGSSLALRLAQCGINVIIIDKKKPFIVTKKNIIPHIRISAINYASVEFFKKINIWKNIPSYFLTSYHRLETWEWPLSKVTFRSISLGLSTMGYIIENNRLLSALWRKFSEFSTITLYCPCKLISICHDGTCWTCVFDDGTVIKSYLLIGADGTFSQIRKQLKIKTTSWQYDQDCMLLTVKVEKHNSGTIWQVFTPYGPIGFLPLYDNWGSLMWYDTPHRIKSLKKLPISILEKKIENNFQNRLGCVKLYNIFSTSLLYQFSHSYISSAAALVGDAARSIHPLAGQGINLGIRDVINLSNLLIKLKTFNTYSNIFEILKCYQNSRQCDAFLMQNSIHLLYIVFHNNLLPLKIARNIAFMVVEHSSYLKKKILKYAVGI